jgi:MarR family transcriptional regulator, organic hydroperoxide resistance regulator
MMFMNFNNIISLISSIRNRSYELIVDELDKEGVNDIAPSHGFILYNLFKRDGITMKEINERINKKKNTVTVLIDKLESRGYVKKEQDEDDKRITRIFLTKKGRSFEKFFNEVSKKLLDITYAGFSDKEKTEIMRLLEKINNNFM